MLSMSKARNPWDQSPRAPSELTRMAFKKLLRGQRERREDDYFYDFAVFNRKGDLIGGVSAMEVARGVSHSAYLSYRIFNNYWGLGYGREAVRAMIAIAFKDLRLHRIEAGIEPSNARSIRLAKSLGMRREGLKKRALFLRERWVDLVMYTLTVEDVGFKFDTSNLKPKLRL